MCPRFLYDLCYQNSDHPLLVFVNDSGKVVMDDYRGCIFGFCGALTDNVNDQVNFRNC